MKCSNCAKEIKQLIHFCPFCGTFLGKEDVLPLENIKLTFLRADLSEFTKISEAMTAEDVMTLLREVFGSFSKIIKFHKGIIYQIIGDEVVAVFGLHRDLKFAPHIAILAAEEMFNVLNEYNRKRTPNNPVGLKIGSEIESASIFNIRGDLRNALIITKGFRKSQLLQKNAPKNSLFIGENLYQATKSFFNFYPVGEFVEDSLSVKAYEYKLKLKV